MTRNDLKYCGETCRANSAPPTEVIQQVLNDCSRRLDLLERLLTNPTAKLPAAQSALASVGHSLSGLADDLRDSLDVVPDRAGPRLAERSGEERAKLVVQGVLAVVTRGLPTDLNLGGKVADVVVSGVADYIAESRPPMTAAERVDLRQRLEALRAVLARAKASLQ